MSDPVTKTTTDDNGNTITEIVSQENWINKQWRPAMGWTYMGICIFDFVVAPLLWSILQAYHHGGVVTTQWQPITLQGGGLFHIAMGAVLGVSAWSRGQEKIKGVANLADGDSK